ncbi:MAG: hypothetical protein JRG71_12245 [Deltaproteobacteria bacterium]|nr:hypothetical protein [Deltaproteobacteria bacterium]
MKILKITTHWTIEEADCIYQLLDEFKCAIWESYGNDIELLYQDRYEEQLRMKIERERGISPLDEPPF